MKTLKSVIWTLRKQKRIATQTIEKLTQEVERIDAGIAALNPSAGGRPPSKTRRRRPRHHLSAEGRRKISLAAKRRWAKVKASKS